MPISTGLAPVRQRPCWAHTDEKRAPAKHERPLLWALSVDSELSTQSLVMVVKSAAYPPSSRTTVYVPAGRSERSSVSVCWPGALMYVLSDFTSVLLGV